MQDFYDFNAKKWDATRRAAWGEFEFGRELLAAKKILDAGCGNGRLNFWLEGNNFTGEYFGVDLSAKLIELARKNFPQRNFAVKDLLNFIQENSFDAVFCVAVLHHFLSPEEQKKALANMFASLQPGGKIFLTVWNLWQPRFWKLFLAQNFSRDLKIPFGRASFREVHAFTKSELRKLLTTAGFKNVKIFYARHGDRSNFLRGRNLIAIAEK
ncbi:MAG: methyltransferase domain-containing protein [Candidatus Peribacteraceae bacterium]|nr:methyltransferase domain-containing protein [Candidatus Peribacteraceae bacterium]